MKPLLPRFRRPHGLALVVVVGGLAAAGCTASGDEVQPPAEALFFPTGLALTPDESTLFVVNSNSNLRYDSGSVVALDLAAVDDAVAAWVDDGQLAAGCLRDESFGETMQCDETPFLIEGATVRTGNFASDIGIQELDSGALRLFLPVRGDPSVTWIDWDPAARSFECGGGGGVPLCDDAHRLARLREDSALDSIDLEPYNIYVDSAGGYAAVTHLTSATVTLVDAPRDGRQPMIADRATGLFNALASGRRGAVGIAGRTPNQPGNLLYVTSLSEDRVQMLSVYRDPQEPESLPLLLHGEFFFLNGVVGSDDSRGISFNADGSRGYVVNRDPPALHVVDTAPDAQGYPANTLDSAVEVCREASAVAVADVGNGERAWVSCFGGGQLMSVDPLRGDTVRATTLGRGPFAIEVAPGRRRLYVTNFLEDTISVIDVAPGSPTENRVVLRLGTSREGE